MLVRLGDVILTILQDQSCDEPGRVIYGNYLQIFIELGKFATDDTELNDARERFIYALNALSNGEKPPKWLLEKDDNLTDLCSSAEFKVLNNEQKEEYMNLREQEESFQRALKYTAEESRAQGEADGIAQGIAQGEANKQREIAAAMIKENIPAEIICKVTGLTSEQLSEIKKDLAAIKKG